MNTTPALALCPAGFLLFGDGTNVYIIVIDLMLSDTAQASHLLLILLSGGTENRRQISEAEILIPCVINTFPYSAFM
ncbi:hypothetical protein D3C81_1072350 [compost metagenome]